jgi:hypothetical protein
MRAGFRFFFSALLLCYVAGRASAQSATCHVADDFSNHLVAMIQSLMVPRDSALRRILGVPLVSTSQVTLVTDSVVCAQAGQAVDSVGRLFAPNEPEPAASSDPLYVVQIGSSFGVLDKNGPIPQHYYHIMYFGPAWEYRSLATF